MRTSENIYSKFEKKLNFTCEIESGILYMSNGEQQIVEYVGDSYPDGRYAIMMDELYRTGDLSGNGWRPDAYCPNGKPSLELSKADMKVLLKELTMLLHDNSFSAMYYVSYRKGELCATDSHVLRRYKLSTGLDTGVEMMLPVQKAVGLLIEDVVITQHHKLNSVTDIVVEYSYFNGEYRVFVPLDIVGNYPDYNQVIPRYDLPGVFEIGSKEFKNNLLPYAKKDPTGACKAFITYDKIISDYEGSLVQAKFPITRIVDVPEREADGVIMPILVNIELKNDHSEDYGELVKRIRSYGVEIILNAANISKVLTSQTKKIVFAYEEPSRAILYWLC